MAELTAERLREMLHYDPETGLFARLVDSKCGRGRVISPRGALASHPIDLGYHAVSVDGVTYKAHRLAWFYVHGKWPSQSIDHIDGNPANNAIANLRDVSHRANMENMRRPKAQNKSGLLGVSPNKKRWAASIKVNWKKVHLGTFDTPEEAHAVYVEAKRRLHAGCTI